MPLELKAIRNRDGEWVELESSGNILLDGHALPISTRIYYQLPTRWQRFSSWMRWFWLDRRWFS